MKVLLKPIFEWVTDGYTLFNYPLYNKISMLIVGIIAFIIAWNTVKFLYKEDVIDSSIAGSIIHWIIRIISFILLFTVVSVIFRVIEFIIAVPIWVWLIIAGVAVVGVFLYVITKSKQKDKVQSNTKVTG